MLLIELKSPNCVARLPVTRCFTRYGNLFLISWVFSDSLEGYFFRFSSAKQCATYEREAANSKGVADVADQLTLFLQEVIFC